MEWSICLVAAAIVFFTSVVCAIVRGQSTYKSHRILDPSKILFVGVIASSVVLFLPIYANAFRTTECGWLETVLIAIHNMIRLFLVDGEFSFITSNLADVPTLVVKGYTALFSILFVMAPVLTFGFVLSFFKNISAYKNYITHYKSHVFIFSELNDKSLALATSLNEKRGDNRFFVFTDVFEKEEEKSYELVEKAKELGAVCFKKDILTINFAFHSKKSDIRFFTIGEDQSENIGQALKLIERFRDRENTHLYVFSTQVEAEILLANAFDTSQSKENGEQPVKAPPKIKVRRVNEVQKLIAHNLYDNGYSNIFSSALPDENGLRRIHAVVIGMGRHGTEMTKALAWFCQMDGYHVEINAFDMDAKADERFEVLCPELMDPKFNGRFDLPGEARYKITVHPNVDVDTKTFHNILAALPETTYVFVALGNDEKNIATAVKLRSLFARMGHNPAIQTVVYNTDKKEALSDVIHFDKKAYNIDFIGDMKSLYSEAVILESALETVAKERHMQWGPEEAFWQYDYNYRSSIASVIHRKMKEKCGIPGITKKSAKRTEEELWNIRILEHRRWNAYMRSEGYVYSGSIEKASRNDLAKMHNCLVPFDDLPLNEQEKDDD